MKVNAVIKPLALSSAGDDYDTRGPNLTGKLLELTYQKSCPSQGGTITTKIKPSMYPNETKLSITIDLPQKSANLDTTFLNSAKMQE